MSASSIRIQLLALVLAVCIPLVAVVGIGIYSDMQQSIIHTKASLQTLASTMVSNTGGKIANARKTLEGLAQRPLVMQVDPKHCDRILQDLPGLNPDYANVTYTNLDGMAVCSAAPRADGKPVNVGKAPWFLKFIEAKQFVVSEPYSGPITGKWVSVLSVPIWNERRKMVGGVQLPLDLNAYDPNIDTRFLPAGSRYGFLAQSGVLIWRNVDPEGLIGSRSISDAAQQIVAAKDGQFERVGSDGVLRLFSVVSMPETGWIAFIGIPSSEVYAAAKGRAIATTGMALLVITLLIALAFIIARRIIRPIAELERSAREVRDGNLAARASLSGPAELVRVAESFNAMTGSIETATAQLEAEISAHKNTVKALRKSEASFRQMFERNDSVMLLIDPGSSRIIDANAAAARFYGYPAERLKTMRIDEISTLSAPAIAEKLAQAAHGQQHLFIFTHRLADARLCIVEVRASPIEIDERTVIFSIINDITERVETEKALQESDDRMKSFFENVPVGLFISTREGKFVYVNPALPRIMGYASAEELMDIIDRTSIAETLYVEPSHRNAVISDLDRVGDRWLSYESRYRRKDGRIIDAAISLGEKIDPVTGESRFYGILTDITQRKQSEAELVAAKQAAENASRAKSSFLAAASHDMRQPIQAIGLFADALAKTQLTAQQQPISLHLAQSVHSLGEILNMLLNISKLDSGSVSPCPEVIPVQHLFKRIDAEFSPMATEKSLFFKLCFTSRAMMLHTDGVLLMSLLGNIIGNAVKYTGRGGVLVGIRRRGRQALFQVWDTGIGIAPEHLGDIFDEYFQIENPQRDSTKGLGLGLSIASRHAKLLGTELVCRSRPDKGSVFEFLIPLTGDTAADAIETATTAR